MAVCGVCGAGVHLRCDRCPGWLHADRSHIGPCTPNAHAEARQATRKARAS